PAQRRQRGDLEGVAVHGAAGGRQDGGLGPVYAARRVHGEPVRRLVAAHAAAACARVVTPVGPAPTLSTWSPTKAAGTAQSQSNVGAEKSSSGGLPPPP